MGGQDHDPSPAEAVVEQIRAAGGVAAANSDSVAARVGADSMVADTLKEFGQLDIVINNAGIIRNRTFLNINAYEFEPVIDVHVKGCFFVSRPAYEHMKSAGYGRIVNTSSGSGLFGSFGQSAYSAAKAAIYGFTRTLAIEGARYGIHVNAIAPGALTRMTVDIFATLCDVFGVNVEQRTHGVSLVPLIEGTVDSVREFVLTGVWGRSVQLLTGDEKLVRSPRHGNRPLSMWSNRWSTMPIHAYPNIRLPRPDERAALDYMPGSNVPVIRQPFEEGDAVPYWAQSASSSTGEDLVFNVVDDPFEKEDRSKSSAHERLSSLLRDALTEIDAPSDQFTRLGL